MAEEKSVGVAFALNGRREITTTASEITSANIVGELNDAISLHRQNAFEIDYLYKYMRGVQPILERVKKVRPEICNRVVENHAVEIARFTSGYIMGEPLTYVRRGNRTTGSTDIDILNDYMFFESKSSHDNDMMNWMAVCGVGYRMVLPQQTEVGDDESPFRIDTPDPRSTFVVYYSGFGHKPMMGVRMVCTPDKRDCVPTYCVYTDKWYFEVKGGKIIRSEPHTLGAVPIIEYRLNSAMLGSFEPALPLLDGINTIQSNRIDGVEQFVQSFLKFKNCDVDTELLDKLAGMGAIAIKSVDGLDSDVEIVAQELNQMHTQTVIDWLYDQALTICGLPTTRKGGTSTSDTGAAVLLRDGWSQSETRARDTEQLFKRSERTFLRVCLRIIRAVREFDLNLSEVDCKFTRRQHDNLLTKTQSLLHMLEAGLHPEVAIATCGLFNDPVDIAIQSQEYLKKWEYIDPLSVEGDTDDMHDNE